MISFTCRCGKQLKAKDESAGKKVRCPQCGQVVSIPGGGVAASAPKTSKPVEQPASKPPVQAPKPKLKKKKARKSSDRHSESSFPVGLVVKALVILGILGGLAYLGVYLRVDNWFRATPPYEIVEVKKVDAFAALHGVGSNVLSLVPGRSEGVRTLGGSNRLVLVRDNPAGDHVLVRMKLHQKYLSDKGAIRQSSVVVGGRDVVLQSEGNKDEAMFLIGQLTGEYANKVSVGLSKIDLPGQRRDPLSALGKKWNTEKLIKPPQQDDPLDTREPQPATGPISYRTPGGMQVDGMVNPNSIELQWDQATTGYSGNSQFEETEHGIFEINFEVLCLFAAPKGNAKLKVFDGPELVVDAQ